VYCLQFCHVSDGRYAHEDHPYHARGSINPVHYRGHHNSVFGVCFVFVHNYGHFLFDFLTGVLHLSPIVIQKMILPTFHNFTFMWTFYPALGLLPSSIFYMKDPDYMTTSHFYVFAPSRIEVIPHLHLAKLRLYFQKYFKLDNIKPTRYIFFNRIQTHRLMGNLVQCFDFFLQFEQLDFELIDHTSFRKEEENVLFYNCVQLLVNIHGAGCSNILFMQ
jgi:capsular polysaccharide biosynthesis protein